jgi:Uma2 family endonuclease
MTVEEYLRFDESSQVRNEYVGGEVYAMSGATLRHNRIVRNIVIALSASAGDGPCEVFSTDLRLRAADDIYYYPDVMVVWEPTGELDLVVTQPCVVVEVTSPSTARIDRGEKLMAYLAIRSLRAYVIVDHRRKRVERHWRREPGTDEWMRDEVVSDGSVSVPCLDVELALDVIYRRVDLAIIAEPEVAEYEA